MALPDLTGQNIQDTYQRVLQTDATGSMRDGTGSLFLPVSASYAVTASYAETALIEITKEVSSSYAETASMASSNFIIQGHVTASGNISASGRLIANDLQLNSQTTTNIVGSKLGLDSSGQVRIDSAGSSINFSRSNVDLLRLIPGSDSAYFIGNITASGNISSSGTITQANSLHAGGGRAYFGEFGGSNTHLSRIGNNLHLSNGGLATSEITASGDISSSGYLYGSRAIVDRIQHNNDVSDIYFANGINVAGGHITASGNISASGAVTFGTDGERQTHTFFGRIRTVGSEVVIGDGHVTASGNISSSGDINAGALGTGSFDHIITSGQTIEFKDGNTKLGAIKMTAAGDMTIADGSTGKSKLKISDLGVTTSTSNIRLLNGHITASGNISASGKLYGTDLYLGNKEFADYHGPSDTFRLSSLSNPVHIFANVTASGDISASGEILADSYTVDGYTGLSSTGTDLLLGNANYWDRIIYGRQFTDRHVFIGNITGSNISASGHLQADSIQLGDSPNTSPSYNLHIRDAASVNAVLEATGNGNATLELKNNQTPDWAIRNKFGQGGLHFTANHHVLHLDDDGTTTISGSLVLSGDGVSSNITASGAISSSTFIYAQDFQAPIGISDGYHIGDGKPVLAINGEGGYLSLGAGHSTYHAAGVKIFTTGSDENAGLFLDSVGNVTASGDISSSGNINASLVNAVNSIMVDGKRIDYDNTNLRVRDTGLNIVGNVTASGNISASRTSTISGGSGSFHILKGDTTKATGLQVSGYVSALTVTSSGHISASANVYAADYFDNGANINTIYAPNGWHGSATRIKILPTDFVADTIGRPIMTQDSGIASNELYTLSFASGDMYAYIHIPTGFKATHTRIYGSDTGQTFTTYEGDIDTKTIAIKGTATAIGTEKAITNVTSDTTNYLVIQVTSDGSTDEIHGGYVTIEAV